MKINLGCGNKKLDGFLNVDYAMQCKPDMIANLEQTPWPFRDNAAEQVNMEHLIEHIGATTESHKKIMQELYRICMPKAQVRVTFPHPRSDAFLIDPTHVRAITVSTFEMYSKKKCQEFIQKKIPTTPLAIYWDIDFEIKSGTKVLYPYWADRYQKKELSNRDLDFAINSYNNVISEIELLLEVNK